MCVNMYVCVHAFVVCVCVGVVWCGVVWCVCVCVWCGVVWCVCVCVCVCVCGLISFSLSSCRPRKERWSARTWTFPSAKIPS